MFCFHRYCLYRLIHQVIAKYGVKAHPVGRWRAQNVMSLKQSIPIALVSDGSKTELWYVYHRLKTFLLTVTLFQLGHDQ